MLAGLYLLHYMRLSSNSVWGLLWEHVAAMSLRSKLITLVFILGFTHMAVDYIYTNEDDMYVSSDKEDLKLDKATQTATFVIIVGYGRTGSSWLGEILSKAEESFYMFEPMQRPLAEGYYLTNMVAFNNNSYRRPLSLMERHDFMITTIHRVFTCQFSLLHTFSQEILVRHQVRLNAGTFTHCRDFNSYRSYFCIKELERVCLSKTHRIVKTIRVSMELVSNMVEMWPNLKVVHLVRDPRAITHSRSKGQDFQMALDTVSHSADMCTRMFEDVKQDWFIQRKYPGRLIIVSYEALAGSPYAATGFIYDFLNMLFREKTWFWVFNSMRNQNETETHYYATVRFNSSKVANRWRESLYYKKVQEIDLSCTDVYKALGYIPISSVEDLNSGKPTRRKVDNIEGYL
ncbi:carbohydrate sulfotransferase 4-like isoform X2 [Ruditapes philippinarum]|uniref:carbohydrate sulfotransferase 4-like isoform X2 n=1 Tax=Ruditapes philippinarum TaxID=129788 RepID=UPI00295A80E3|nr:carbohydrate sulfotransferase 4-like isoform X2 [Ruditapes philippinarum]